LPPSATFLLCLLFDPVVGCNMFLLSQPQGIYYNPDDHSSIFRSLREYSWKNITEASKTLFWTNRRSIHSPSFNWTVYINSKADKLTIRNTLGQDGPSGIVWLVFCLSTFSFYHVFSVAHRKLEHNTST
jgi:hypothetical protein